MNYAARLVPAKRTADTSQPFDRLFRFNWSSQFFVIYAGMLASFLIAGFWYPYWRITDMDFFIVYNALEINAGLPQEFFGHPCYLLILLLSYWLRALHALGIINVSSLSVVPPVIDLANFGAAWTQATRAGRVLSLILAMGFVTTFAYLLRALVRDWRIAGFGGFLLAFSGGMAMEMRILRTELLAAGLFTIALLMLLVVARRGERAWRPAVIGLAALLITLGMQSKVQVFFLICALPVLLLPFGPDPMALPATQRGFWRTPQRAWPALAFAVALALVGVYFARNLLILGFANSSSADVPLAPIGVSASTYWALVAVWIGLGLAAYRIVWSVGTLETLASGFAAVAGCMIGLLALYARYQPDNVMVVFHPLETMLAWASAADPRLSGASSWLGQTRVEFLVDAIAGIIARRTFFLYSSARPGIFLEWFVIAATVIAIHRRQWRLVLAVAALMVTDWTIDLLGMGRHLQQVYFLFTDPLGIIAAALLITQLPDLQQHRWAYPIGMALIAVHVVVSQAEPIKHVFSHKSAQDLLCTEEFWTYYRRLGQFPFCPPQTVPAQ
jgi:hypothetical protein